MQNYAGFWIRVGAYLIDSVVILIGEWIVFSVFGVSLFSMASLDPEASNIFATAGGSIAYAITLIGGVLYFALMESSAKQATLGKMALGLIVTDLNGNRISPARAVGRYFAKILSAIIFMIGFIMVAFTQRKQGLHDMLASTLVLRAKPGETGIDVDTFA